jgi:hypothetical protein
MSNFAEFRALFTFQDDLAENPMSFMILGSGLIDQSQNMTVAARAMAEKKAVGHRS